jgi:hypothetical protein
MSLVCELYCDFQRCFAAFFIPLALTEFLTSGKFTAAHIFSASFIDLALCSHSQQKRSLFLQSQLFQICHDFTIQHGRISLIRSRANNHPDDHDPRAAAGPCLRPAQVPSFFDHVASGSFLLIAAPKLALRIC